MNGGAISKMGTKREKGVFVAGGEDMESLAMES